MAWWDDIREMLRQELGPRDAAVAEVTPTPQPLQQAQRLLQRTARELADARARADTVRRRLARAQQQLETLTRAPQGHPRYRERLVDLARAIARDSDIAGSFQSHLAELDRLHDQVNRQLRELDHDLSMARAASVIGEATRAVARAGKTGKNGPTTTGPSGEGVRPTPRRTAARTTSLAAKPAPAARRGATKAETPAAAPGFRRARADRVMDTLQQLPRRRNGKKPDEN